MFYLEKLQEIVFEEELAKFKPGIESNFLNRWIQLTSHSLRYYKSHYQSAQFGARPINSIPFHLIQSVKKFEINQTNLSTFEKKKLNHSKYKDLYKFMFEVNLIEDYEDIFYLRDYEFNLHAEDFHIVDQLHTRNQSHSARNLTPSPSKFNTKNSSRSPSVQKLR